MSNETKKRASEAKKGQIPWNKGKKMPESMRLKMVGNKNGSGNKGRSVPKEHIRRMVKAREGLPPPMLGKKIPVDQRKKMSDAKYAFYERNGIVLLEDHRHTRLRDRKARRRIRIKTNGGIHSKAEWELLKESQEYKCLVCLRKEPEIKLTRDHILAILRGGTDDIGNIQALCVSCNSKKGTNQL